jgi:3',5'-cyclic AMP phosphodiesterase CpdA
LKFTLAHLSDVHLGPVPLSAGLSDFRLKRMIGITSWTLKRRKRHIPAIANALLADIVAHKPDHIANTGDMVNIAAACEFGPARAWLERLGSADRVSYVPGNHDAYVPVPFERGLGHFADYMRGEMRLGADGDDMSFPYVRLRRNIAIIGLNTGQPQALHRASGSLGAEQLRDLEIILVDTKQRGYCRVILIHHPPLPGLAPQRRGLTDAEEFTEVIKRAGAELVLYGHNHQMKMDHVEGPAGRIPVMGVASASMRQTEHHPAASWRLFAIDRAKGKWQIRAMERRWSDAAQSFATIAPFTGVN